MHRLVVPQFWIAPSGGPFWSKIGQLLTFYDLSTPRFFERPGYVTAPATGSESENAKGHGGLHHSVCALGQS